MANATALVSRRGINALLTGAVGTGPSSIIFASSPQVIDGATLLCQAILSGSFSALTLNFQISTDNGTTWSTAQTWDVVSSGTYSVFQISEAALYRFNVATFTGGTSVSINGLLAGISSAQASTGGGGGGTVNQGVPAAPAAAWPVEITDGSGNVIGGSSDSGTRGLNVHVDNAQPTNATNPLGQSIPVQADLTGNLKVVEGNPDNVTVHQEILKELRVIRQALLIVYEEAGQGSLDTLLDE